MQSANSSLPISKSYLQSLILKCALIFTGGIILTAVILFLSFPQQFGPSYGESFRMLSLLKREVFVKSIIIYTFTLVLIVMGIVVITLLYSHRIVGPIYRLNQFMKKIAAADLSENTALRKNDAIHPIADEINILIESYRIRLKNLEKKSKTLRKITSQSNREIIDKGESPDGEIIQLIDEIREELKSLTL